MNTNQAKPKLYALFFSLAGEDMVEVGDKGAGWSNVEPVSPKWIAQFSAQWATYKAGRDDKPTRDGSTPLTKVPGIDLAAMRMLSDKGIDCAEHLAGLDDRSAMLIDDKLGRVWRDTAKLLVATKAPAAAVSSTLRAPEQNQHRKAA